jgi:uncharacterized iron-regulated membrane protein
MSIARRRQLFTAIHRYLGLATMAFLLIAAITGCLLCVDTSIDAALNPDLFKTSARGPLLSPTEAVERLERARPDLIVTQYPLRTKPGRTIKAIVAPRAPGRSLGLDQLFLDPHDGRIAGTRQSGAGLDRRHIMDAVFSFHYTLLAGKWGRWLMGVAALGWLVGNLVGVYITLPVTKPFWRKWRRIWQIDLRARLRWLMLDVHRATGLWLLIGVSLLAFTSVAMNFYDEAFTPITSAISPAHPSPFDRPPPPAPPQPAARIGFGQALTAANRIAADRRLHWLPAVETYLPDRRLYGVTFTASGYETYRGLGPITYYLDAGSGRFVFADDPYRDSGGRKLSRSLYPLHSGEVIGPLGTAMIFLLGIATAEMCVTGFYTWWKKRRSRLPRPASR